MPELSLSKFTGLQRGSLIVLLPKNSRAVLPKWYGVDLDGTLATTVAGRSADEIGDPIYPTIHWVKQLLSRGETVLVFTARVWTDGSPQRDEWKRASQQAIREWTAKHIGVPLNSTNEKDPGMVFLADNRAENRQTDTGLPPGWSIY